MPRFLPLRASVEWLKKTAKDQLDVIRHSTPEAKLHDAQLKLAREYGFPNWRAMIEHVETVREQLRKVFPVLATFPIAVEAVEPNDPQLLSLLEAVRAGDVGAVSKILAARPALVNAYGPAGQTALHVAAQFNDARLAIVLLAHDADPDMQIRDSGHNALSWAATCHATDYARTLVRLAVQPDLYAAAGLGLLEQVQGSFAEDGTLLAGASWTGSTRREASGARLPCPPSTAIDQISDALCHASRNGQTPVVQFLLDKPHDLAFRSFLGATALHWACFSGSEETISVLQSVGADLDAIDDCFGVTPEFFGICAAASWGLLFKVEALVRRDAALASCQGGPTTPLHEAAGAGHHDIVRFLLENGADRSAVNAHNRTPLDRAMEHGHQSVIEILSAE